MLLVGNIVSPKGLAYMCVCIDILFYITQICIFSLIPYYIINLTPTPTLLQRASLYSKWRPSQKTSLTLLLCFITSVVIQYVKIEE